MSSLIRFRSSRVKNGLLVEAGARGVADDDADLFEGTAERRAATTVGLVASCCSKLVFFSTPPRISFNKARFRSSSAFC